MAEKDKKDSKRDKPMTREEALENALKQIEKNHGKGAIMRLGEAKANMNIEVISTDSTARHCPWRWRYPTRAHYRGIRAGILRKDNCYFAHDCRGTKGRGACCFY